MQLIGEDVGLLNGLGCVKNTLLPNKHDAFGLDVFHGASIEFGKGHLGHAEFP